MTASVQFICRLCKSHNVFVPVTPGKLSFSSNLMAECSMTGMHQTSMRCTAQRLQHSFDSTIVVMTVEHHKRPLGQLNSADAVEREPHGASYAALVAEADELLKQVQSTRPAQQDTQRQREEEERARKRLAAKQNQLTVVRVRVRPASLFVSTLQTSRSSDMTLLTQVAGRTFGVPAQLAERIAVYTDNETKQQQLDRQCQAYKLQRRLQERGQASLTAHIDHVLLNKAAIVIPAAPDIGRPGNLICNIAVKLAYTATDCAP